LNPANQDRTGRRPNNRRPHRESRLQAPIILWAAGGITLTIILLWLFVGRPFAAHGQNLEQPAIEEEPPELVQAASQTKEPNEPAIASEPVEKPKTEAEAKPQPDLGPEAPVRIPDKAIPEIARNRAKESPPEAETAQRTPGETSNPAGGAPTAMLEENKAAKADTSAVKKTPTESSDVSGGWAQPKRKAPLASKPGYVTNTFFDTPIREALSEIALQADETIVPDASIQGLVTCDLKEVPVEKALDIVLSIGNFAWRRMDGFILVGSPDSESSLFSIFSVTRRIKMNYIKAEEAVKMLAKPMQKLASANVSNNSVSVTAPPVLLERIISDLKLIDQPPRHVLLDARVVVMEGSNLLNLGIQWGWPKISAGAFSDSEHQGQWPWGIQIGYTTGKEFTNSLQMALNFLTQNDDAAVVASPQVLAQDGQQAEIKVATEEYFKITSPSAYYVQFQLEKISSGTTLTITPRIGDNNEITLETITEVSDVTARGADNLPIVTRRSTKNTVRLSDGGTAAVAGLMDSRTRLNKVGTPGLAKLPLLGGLFRNSTTQNSSRQVAVFITARLMPRLEPPVGQEYSKRPLIKPVGREFKIALQEVILRLRTGDQEL
jgi:type II secretory pathway component GspD/PulD (secretin)